MEYRTLSELEQREAYEEGYRKGTLVKLGYKRVSSYVVNSIGDFPLGSWSHQHTCGYIDGSKGLPFTFLAVCIPKPKPTTKG